MAIARLRLVFHPGVADDLQAIVDYYGERDPILPARFRARFLEQIDRLVSLPESGAVLFEDVRRVVIKRFPYLIAYRVTGAEILVLAVISFQRDPASVEDVLSSRSSDR